MKKAVALFLTLSLILIITYFIASILNSYSEIAKKNYIFIAQNSVIINDTVNILKNLEINESTLDEIFTTFPISSKNGDFRAIVTITPVKTININDYLKNRKIDKNIDKLLEFICYKYDIKDPLFLKNLILDTIDKDTKERMPFSEIIQKNPFFQNGKIYNLNHFKTILNYYEKETLDKNVKKIPWEKYFNFKITQLYNPNEDIINLNTQKETTFNIISFEKAKKFYVNVIIEYIFGVNQKIDILYDLKNKKVYNIEINPIY
jgi:hypothetical protein